MLAVGGLVTMLLTVHMTGFTGHHEAPGSLSAQCLEERVAHPADTTSRSSAACGPLTIFSLKRSVKLDGVDHSAKDRLMDRTTIFITGRKPCAGQWVQHRYDGVRSYRDELVRDLQSLCAS
jgi:hypothetical protein